MLLNYKNKYPSNVYIYNIKEKTLGTLKIFYNLNENIQYLISKLNGDARIAKIDSLQMVDLGNNMIYYNDNSNVYIAIYGVPHVNELKSFTTRRVIDGFLQKNDEVCLKLNNKNMARLQMEINSLIHMPNVFGFGMRNYDSSTILYALDANTIFYCNNKPNEIFIGFALYE
jgi:hypothetical protein